ncbi:hypothetical protein L1080_004325 [Rhodococcus sp. MSC1_016]|jgi:hypothetical protein|uniref:hypothetical protein n=1 Tax=Rhodococcus sp. MSC1_016 TaxID=2909266 RepID=UPI00202EC278|nr:hypothetical protein [Rhodococcus sp. MSC1_016]
MGTYWADVSQYQRVVDDTYPHRVFSFRTNSGDKLDTNAAANLAWGLRALDEGRIDVLIPYYFFRPGQANCDLWRQVVTVDGKIDPRIVCMVDVEGDRGTVYGDHSAELNAEVSRVQGWLGGRRVIGYLNPMADPRLWLTRPGIPLVVPHYNSTPGQSYDFLNRFAHQYSDRVLCAPFGPCDANYTHLEIPELLTLFGITEGVTMTDVVREGAAQLHPFAGKLRQIGTPANVNESTRSTQEPWPYDIWADLWNEAVWDGYDFDAAMADVPDDVKRSLVGLVRTIGARQSRIEGKLDALLEKLEK